MAKSVYEQLYNLAYSWISYMNSEQVQSYTEHQLALYKAGMEPTPYQDVATGMIAQEVTAGGTSTQRVRDILGAYVANSQSGNSKLVEQVITAAISDYLNTGTQAISEATKKGDCLHCCDVPYQAGKTFMVTGIDTKGNFVLIGTDTLQQKDPQDISFTDFWRVSPSYLEQHFTTF